MSLYLPVHIRRRSGELVKLFEIGGGQNIESIILWIWRDVFLTMLAADRPRYPEVIGEMLGEIEEVLGWKVLERILYGGKQSRLGLLEPMDVC
jgi:hypothetical protein